MNSNLTLVEDPDGRQYYKNIIDCPLSNEETSLLTSLEHPNLVGNYHTGEQETNQIIFDYCEFGLFSNLHLSKLALDAHVLWSIRNQILQALKYLASHGLYHKGLNVSNVLVCSLCPICIKLSLFSHSRVLIAPVNTEIPIQEFWKEKVNQQEEVCFDELIRSIVKSVFPYSIMDKNIFFTNPNTLERNDFESLKALICSIESETMFKSDQFIGDFSSVNNNFSCIFKSIKSQEQKNLFLSQTLLFHVFIQEFLKFGSPLLEFDVDNCLFECRNKDFSTFATKLISISFNFRNVFFSALDSVCSSSVHCLVIGITGCYPHSMISSRFNKTSQLSTFSVFYLNWLKRFPITSITAFTLNFDTEFIDKQKITNLDLSYFDQELTAITLFPNLYSFRLNLSEVVHDFSVLALCRNLRSVSISSCSISDLTPFSNIEQLTSFSLLDVNVSYFSDLSTFKWLTKLSLDDCNFTDLSILSPLQELRILSLCANGISDLSPLSCLKFLEELTLDYNQISDLSPLAALENLVDLSLDYSGITDISPLSSLVKLERLSLVYVPVRYIWPLKNLIKLSTLDVSETLLPREHQRLLTNSSDIQALINSFEHGVDLDFSNYDDIVDLSLYSHCSRLKSLNLSHKRVENISEISKFTNLETLDLSNVTLDGNRITDISFLSSCFKLKSLTLDDSDIIDLSPLSLLVELESLSLKNATVFDLWPLKYLRKLSTLDVRETLLPREHQRELTNSYDIKALINSFEHGVFGLDFFYSINTVNLSLYSHCKTLKSLNLCGKEVENTSEISKFTNLETLDLSNVKLGYNSYRQIVRITDISYLSSCIKLKSLSLDCSKVTDLGPLSLLVELESLSVYNTKVFDLWTLRYLSKLSTLDVRETLLPREHQRKLTDSYDIKALINSFEHGVFDLDFSNFSYVVDLSLYSHCSRLKSLNWSHKRVGNIFELSKFTNLENLDLSNAKLPNNHKITGISFLSSCFKLKSLSLDGSNVTDLSPLFLLSNNLKSLSLNYTPFTNLRQFSNFKQLEFLSLDCSNITDISPLSSLQNLRILSMFNNKISDLSPLSCLKFLEKLVLRDNRIADTSHLASLENLVDLSLNNNKITDMRPLSSLFKLERLSLYNTLVFDLWPLKHLTNLSTLDVRETLLPREHQRELTNSSDFKALVNSFEHGVDLDFSNSHDTVNLSFYSHCSKLKSLNLSNKRVRNISEISKFTNLETLDLSNVKLGYNIHGAVRISDTSFLSSCIKLKSISLDGSIVTDLSPFSVLVKLECLSLKGSEVFDLWALRYLRKLCTLNVRKTLLPREHQRELTNSSDIKALVNSFEHGVDLDFSNYNYIVDLSFYPNCSRLKSLNLSNKWVENTSEISKFTNLETLDLSNVKLGYNSYCQIVRITDISFLSSCFKLKSLSLDRSRVTDLSPLSLLVELESLSVYNTKVFDLWPLRYLSKLSTLDVRETLLPREHQRKLTDSSDIQTLINSFEHGVDLDFSNTRDTVNLSLYSHCSRLKSLKLLHRKVENISEISKFTNLETLDLMYNNKITDTSLLSSLQNLRVLSLHENKISDLSPLSCLKFLQILKLDSNQISDLSPVAALENLVDLSLCRSNITDISPLSSLQNLRILSLCDNKISDLSPLSCLKFLEKLALNWNKVSDVSPLASLQNLVDLSLTFSRIADLRPLSSLVKLERLSLYFTKVFDLWPLKHLINLSTLDVRETFLPREHQRELTNSSDIQALINSFEHGVDLDFSNTRDTVNLSLYSHCSRLKSLKLLHRRVENISEIFKFTNLETLDLSNVTLDGNRIDDISFLSSCIKLKSLSLEGSKVTDLSPLSLLSNNLKSLSLNNSLFPNLSQLSNFKQLEFLSLNSNNITDISPLSLLENLTNLSLYNTKVSDLSSLQYLSKLSFLDVRETLLPQEHQQRVSGLSCVHEFLNYFADLAEDSSSNQSTRKRTCSSELSLKKVNN
ncbi:hypothetical protein RCL1_002553 [Eukaryota sp. TZLM3-RCL]